MTGLQLLGRYHYDPLDRLVSTVCGYHTLPGGLLHAQGFNGECPDPVTGHYLLGHGHRLFNTALMRFNSSDSLSPFGNGGLNAYAYCQGDPVNYRDRTGRIRGSAFKGLSPRLSPRSIANVSLDESAVLDVPSPQRFWRPWGDASEPGQRPLSPVASTSSEPVAGPSTSASVIAPNADAPPLTSENQRKYSGVVIHSADELRGMTTARLVSIYKFNGPLGKSISKLPVPIRKRYLEQTLFILHKASAKQLGITQRWLITVRSRTHKKLWLLTKAQDSISTIRKA